MKPIKHTRKALVPLLALAGSVLAACGPDPAAPPGGAGREAQIEANYVDPPRIAEVARAGGDLVLGGEAAPGAQVRLATPQGESQLTRADDDGAWRMTFAAPAQPQIYGLSMSLGERRVQAEGYQLLLPDGRLVRLHGGAGAWLVDGRQEPRITAFDFDEEGGAIVTGQAPPEAAFTVRIDGRPVSTNGRADASGRFTLPFGAPVPPGRHRIEIQGEGFALTGIVDATPAAPPQGAAFQATMTPLGLRIDWLTPGGGLQSTLILSEAQS
ncbi:MAG: carboxypeptidase-like regulatory domain-containing protein [Pseudomonadota bacterium]